MTEMVTAAQPGPCMATLSALQRIPSRQRAVLILLDVLDWRAGDVAELLGSTTASIEVDLRKARSALTP